MVSDPLESINRPAKMIKLDDGRNSSFSGASLNVSNINGAATSQVSGTGSLPRNVVPKSEEVHLEKQISQVMCSRGCCQWSLIVCVCISVYFHASTGMDSYQIVLFH